MSDRVHPSTTLTANGANPAFPAAKLNVPRPAYRPQPPPPPRRRHHRISCCRCMWTTILMLTTVFLLAGAVFYLVYRPHRPSFSVAALDISKLNLTDATSIFIFNLTLTARNPNTKIVFLYDEIPVKILSAEGVDVRGYFPGFTQSKKSVTSLGMALSSRPSRNDTPVKSSSKSNDDDLSLKIQLDTKVKFKIGRIKTKKLRIRVICNGIKAQVPTGRTPSVAAISNVKCKVDPRIKIVKWTI